MSPSPWTGSAIVAIRNQYWSQASSTSCSGFVMVEQVKSIDFRSRKAKRIAKASSGMLEEVLSILDACIY